MMAMTTYHIADDGKSITCMHCGMTSHNPNDVQQHYCGYCHRFHDDLWSCGHVAGSMCQECYRELAARAHELAEENLRLRDAMSWLRDHDPQLVDAATEKFAKERS